MNFIKSLKSSDYKEFVSIFNAENAKLLAFVIAFWLFVFHAYFYFTYGGDRCEWILKVGRPVSSDSWQPYGCMMHKYDYKDSRLCMNYVAYWGGRSRLVFIGDSRIRQIYEEVVNLFQPGQNRTKYHSDLEYVDEKVALELKFRWQPMVNESMYSEFKKWVDSEKHNRPTLVVVGSGTWAIKENNASVSAKNNFRANLTTIMPLIEKLHHTSEVIWMLQDDVIESLLSVNRSMITNDQISLYNSAVMELFRYSSASIWSSNRLISHSYTASSGDGLHISENALKLDVQVLMNYYCNRHLNHPDATCCRTPEPVTFSQYTVIFIFMSAVFLSVTTFFSWRLSRPVNGFRLPPEFSGGSVQKATISTASLHPTRLTYALTCLSRFAIVMLYMFVCDRTDFFMRENKQSGLVNFFLPLAYALALGIFFTERLEGRAAGFMNRFQTEEWKGWMQLAILLYHLSGASTVVPVYVCVRALVSAYVFLNGYAHTTYLLNGGVFGFQRLCRQLFRLNFLTLMMCVTMNRPYMFYYFVPLITFWFLAVNLLFSIPPRPIFRSQELPPANGQQPLVSGATMGPLLNALVRLAILFIFISVLHYSESVFNQIFLWAPIKFLFVTSDDSLHEWRFRWEVDRYSALSGATFAVVVAFLRQRAMIPDSDTAACRPLSALLIALGSFVTMIGFGINAILCEHKELCNRVHPWVVGPLILSYVLFRNLPAAFRSRYSSFLAWFGHISLELFLAQYHIWLASDTRGVLVLIPNFPALSVLTSSFIFVCAAHELQNATSRLAELLVPTATHLLIRNFVLFCLSLLLAANFHLFLPRTTMV